MNDVEYKRSPPLSNKAPIDEPERPGGGQPVSGYEERIYPVKGTPFEIGQALGRALGPRLAANIERYVRERLAHGDTVDAAQWQAGALPWLRTLPARFQEEFEGLAHGAALPLQRLAEWAYVEVILSAGCSAAIAELDDHVWVARNNDTFAPGMWGYVTIREVTGRIPTISFGLEGDVFTPTGINGERLWLHYNYLPAWDEPQAGQPHLPCYAFLVEALETCRTLGDVEGLLARLPRDGGMLLFAVDGKTDEYALYECTCTTTYKYEASQGWLAGTNHYRAHPQAPPVARGEPLSTVPRYERLTTLVQRLISAGNRERPVPALRAVLADDGVEVRAGETVTGNR
jgi:hypothetical protein